MKLAILILNYNTPELTRSLCEMVPEAIVIDNGSDCTLSSLNEKFKSNEILSLKQNYGFTIGWNKAIEHFINDYDALWLMNSDIMISRESVERIKSLIDNQMFDMITPSYNCWMKHCLNHNTGSCREVKVIEFTAPVIKTEVFKKTGLFDPRFSKGWGVEFDFCHRARSAGFRIWVDDESNFYHIGQQTIHITEGGYDTYGPAAHKEWIIGMNSLYGKNWQLKLYGDSDYIKSIKA